MSDSSREGALSYNQQALWFASKLDSTAYNLAYGFRIQEYFHRMAPELFRELFLRPAGQEGELEALLPRSEVFLRVFQENAAAMFAYAPRPYPGRLVFLHAQERDAINPRHPELAWIPLAAEGVEVHVVSGNHVTMLAEPHVQGLARKVRGVLVERERRPRL